MSKVKEILVKPIASRDANAFIKKHHYSGKVVNNSTLHFGCFLGDVLHGVLSYGNSIDKRKMLGLVEGTKWNEFLELNRMAFDESLPKYSESRCISITIRLIKKHYPHIKWIVSFADGIQCGDGTIYRASGFLLTGINSKAELLRMPTGEVRHRIAMHTDSKLVYAMGGKMASIKKLAEHLNGKILNGHQFRYIYLLDKSCKITIPILPFSKIDEMGAGMYKGEKRQIKCAGSSKSEQAISNSKVAENYRPQRSIITKPKIKKLAKSQ